MQIIKYPEKKTWSSILTRPQFNNESLTETVKEVINSVRKEGDKAIRFFCSKFDKVSLESFITTEAEFEIAEQLVTEELKQAIQLAKSNIEKFHSNQKFVSNKIETTQGVVCWQKAVAIEKVGLYIPGGTAPLFSTVLMLTIPAKIAGCKEIILCSPPNKEGEIHPAILYAAKIAGVSKVYKIGGVQAIAAMALGTETVPKVYKIFGPGNQYVMRAKQLLSMNNVAIDMPAGPSEVLVIADKAANPAFVASDLLSQAEHGMDSQVILVSKDDEIIQSTLKEIEKQIINLPRKDIAQKALENSKAVLLASDEEIIELSNFYAPEHLIIQTNNYDKFAEKVINAGSVFLGAFTPESAGDYASGTNHTLPTSGFAKSYSGVNLDAFIKKITFQEISSSGLKNIGKSIEIMAESEELYAHKNAVTLRLNTLK